MSNFSRLGWAIAMLAFCTCANSSARPETNACSLTKTYVNGDRVSISCRKGFQCDFVVRTGNGSSKAHIDFSAYKRVPQLGSLQLFPGGDKDSFSVVTDVECNSEDMEAIDESATDALCLMELSFDHGVTTTDPAVHILPIGLQTIYRNASGSS